MLRRLLVGFVALLSVALGVAQTTYNCTQYQAHTSFGNLGPFESSYQAPAQDAANWYQGNGTKTCQVSGQTGSNSYTVDTAHTTASGWTVLQICSLSPGTPSQYTGGYNTQSGNCNLNCPAAGSAAIFNVHESTVKRVIYRAHRPDSSSLR